MTVWEAMNRAECEQTLDHDLYGVDCIDLWKDLYRSLQGTELVEAILARCESWLVVIDDVTEEDKAAFLADLEKEAVS